jgi:hypothetical protein
LVLALSHYLQRAGGVGADRFGRPELGFPHPRQSEAGNGGESQNEEEVHSGAH